MTRLPTHHVLGGNVRWITSLLLTLAFLLSAPLPGAAQTQEELEVAVRLAQEADSAFAAEQWEQALEKYRAANAIVRNGVLLFNISRSYAKLGQLEEALEAAQDADELAQDLGPEARDENLAFIRAYQTALAARSVARDVEALGQQQGQCVPQAETCNLSDDDCDGQVDEGLDCGGGGGIGAVGWAGVVAVVAGAGLFGGSLVVDAGLASDIEQYNADSVAFGEDDVLTPEEREDLSAQFEAIEDRQSLGRALFFGGTGLAVAGLSMLVIDLLFLSDDSEAAASADSAPGHRRAYYLYGGPSAAGGAQLGLVVPFF